MRPLPVSIPAGILLAALLPLSGCNLQEPGQGPIVLHLTLHDSLQRYDSVQVAIADAARPESDLEMMRSGPLDASQIPAYTLTKAKDPFVVKVRGYRGNHQLALETHIYYEGGRKRVVRQEVPPQVPNNWLTSLAPSAGSLVPGFSLDHLDYTLNLPQNTAVLYFNMQPVYNRAVTTVAGDTLKIGGTPKVFPIRGEAFLVPIAITDLGTTRTYNVSVKPVVPKARLDSVWFSAGTLERPFDPERDSITLILPMEVNSVQLKFWTADDASTSITFGGLPLFAGEVKTVNLSSRPSHFETAKLVVRKSADEFAYTVTVQR